MSSTTTRGVRVDVDARYHPEHSQPAEGRWFFSYTVTITNDGTQTVQLVARTWRITNADGDVQLVEGEGVVGEQPVLDPGASFTYTSFCPLDTSLGAMEGSYTMVADDGGRFEARIDAFTLADPDALN